MQIYELTSAAMVKESGKLAAFADALQRHNAYQAGLGHLVDKEGPEVEVDYTTGEITIGGQKYNPTDPNHIKALRNYGTHNILQQPNSQTSRPAAGQQPATAPTAASPLVRVGGQVLDPNNPADAKILAKLQAQQAPQQPAPQAQQPQQTPRQLAPPTPEQIRKAKQQAAAAAAQRAMTESLSWSRSFDPSRTLLKKIRQL